jgi:hypothetical protein
MSRGFIGYTTEDAGREWSIIDRICSVLFSYLHIHKEVMSTCSSA